MTNIPHKPIGESKDSYDPSLSTGIYGTAQPQPLNDGELRQTISEILVKWSMPTRQAAISEIIQVIAHSPSTEAAVKDTKSCSLEVLDARIEIIHDFMVNGYINALAEPVVSSIARELQTERAALESVTTDEGDGV